MVDTFRTAGCGAPHNVRGSSQNLAIITTYPNRLAIATKATMETQSGRRKRQATENLYWSHHGTRKSSKRPQKRSRRPASRKEMQTEPGSTKLLKSNPQYEQIGIQHHKLQMTTRPRSFLSLLKTKTLHNAMEARRRQLILVLSITKAVGRKDQRKEQRKKQNPIFRKQ